MGNTGSELRENSVKNVEGTPASRRENQNPVSRSIVKLLVLDVSILKNDIWDSRQVWKELAKEEVEFFAS